VWLRWLCRRAVGSEAVRVIAAEAAWTTQQRLQKQHTIIHQFNSSSQHHWTACAGRSLTICHLYSSCACHITDYSTNLKLATDISARKLRHFSDTRFQYLSDIITADFKRQHTQGYLCHTGMHTCSEVLTHKVNFKNWYRHLATVQLWLGSPRQSPGAIKRL